MTKLHVQTISPSADETTTDHLREDGGYVFHHPPKFEWDRDVEAPPQRWGDYSVYLHVPFCRKICTFCTFERLRLAPGSIESFAEHLWKEMDALQAIDDFSSGRVESLYMGGGTASLMSNAHVAEVVRRLEVGFGLDRSVEITLESEPGTKKRDDFPVLMDAGVNRISVGIQAFQDHHLKELNRSHTSRQALEMVEFAQQGGIENLHIDLMFGLPGQTMAEWKESVDIAASLGLQHISTYQMILFPSETLARRIHQGLAPPQPEPELVTEMRSYAEQVFEGQGLARYSLTEFAQPGRSCRYVRATWDGSDYLGLGPAAYTRRGRWLWENSVVHQTYQRQVSEGRRGAGKTVEMTQRETMGRDLAMGLCLLELDLDEVERRAGLSVDEFAPEIDELSRLGLVTRQGATLSLTSEGIRFATHVMKVFTA